MESHCIDEVRRAMLRPGFYPHPVTGVELRETHISIVFLTGSYAYKIKKPVNLGFLDFTTLEQRRHACLQELTLNRRLSEGVYLEVIAVTAEAQGFALNGRGPVKEYAVKMRQLPDDCRMDQLLPKGKIDPGRIAALADRLAGFYAQAAPVRPLDDLDVWDTVRVNCEENFRQTEDMAGATLDARLWKIVKAATLSFLHNRRDLFQKRFTSGKIRDCHGDLKVEHVYFAESLQIIDCIEFNERFRFGDISADLAFLVMDLDFRGFDDIGRTLLDACVQHSQDQAMFVLMDFYKCYRACVRIKVNCFRLQDRLLADYERNRLTHATRRYLKLAYQYAIQFSRPTLWVVCGLPASGKSSLSQVLAETLGVAVFSSDATRKSLFGLTPTATQMVPFRQGIYDPKATTLTYNRLLMSAQEELKQGRSVILDATYSKKEQRREAIRLARDMDCQPIFVECRAAPDALRQRLLQRETQAGVSDARLSHLRRFQRHFQPLEEIDASIHLTVDTGQPMASTIYRVLARHNAIMGEHGRKAVKGLRG